MNSGREARGGPRAWTLIALLLVLTSGCIAGRGRTTQDIICESLSRNFSKASSDFDVFNRRLEFLQAEAALDRMENAVSQAETKCPPGAAQSSRNLLTSYRQLLAANRERYGDRVGSPAGR